MKLDIQRLDERIKKLQEIRRIAADPEMVSILLEFVLPEDRVSVPLHTTTAGADGAQAPQDDVEGLIKNELLKEASAAPQTSGSIWGIRRG